MATAIHDPDKQTFTLRVTGWFDTYPISDLPKWLTFYRRMREEHPKSGTSYDATIAALENLAAELGVKVVE
ncbi:hypothetical protein [Gemmobacter sp. 24YEA27]|uniref:hypothetical protein n=1 Tax=Gemmobacter sp. 24YEA27 TaxID=3040672 RepID=UPI0024B3947E|nr:hypothetical protein [Gemmobacter sp. 24YEA27]